MRKHTGIAGKVVCNVALLPVPKGGCSKCGHRLPHRTKGETCSLECGGTSGSKGYRAHCIPCKPNYLNTGIVRLPEGET